jgi:hypothetical protein
MHIKFNEAMDDIKELAITNECYRQKSIELTNKNSNSTSVSQRSTLAKTKPRSSGLETWKTLVENSDDGGDKDPMNKNLETSHVVHTSVNRKRETRKMGLEIPKIEESPGAMDVVEVIDEPSWSEKQLLETREIVEALVTQEPNIFEE